MRTHGEVDLQELLDQARLMQRGLVDAQSELSNLDVTGRAGPDLVTITMSAGGEYRSVTIDPSAVNARDVESLEALVLAALRNAADTIREMTEERLRPLSERLGA